MQPRIRRRWLTVTGCGPEAHCGSCCSTCLYLIIYEMLFCSTAVLSLLKYRKLYSNLAHLLWLPKRRPPLTDIIYLVWVPECACHGIWVRWQLAEVSSLLPPIGLGLNLDCQANMKCVNVISNAWTENLENY